MHRIVLKISLSNHVTIRREKQTCQKSKFQTFLFSESLKFLSKANHAQVPIKSRRLLSGEATSDARQGWNSQCGQGLTSGTNSRRFDYARFLRSANQRK